MPCAVTASQTARAAKGETSASRAARIRGRQHLEHRAPARILRNHRELAHGARARGAHRRGDAAPGRRSGSQMPQADESTIGWFESAFAGRGCGDCSVMDTSAGPVPPARDDPYRARDKWRRAARLAPRPHPVLDNGTIRHREGCGRHAAVTLLMRHSRPGTIFDPPSELGCRAFRVAHDRPRNGHAYRATTSPTSRDRGVSLAMTVNRHAVVTGLHVPGRGLRRDPRHARRHRDAAGISRSRG